MPVNSFDPPDVWSPFGAFSTAVLQGQGQVIYLKGQVSLDSEGCLVGKGDMPAQVRKTLANISAVLASVGGQMQDIISLTQHVTDMDAFIQTSDIRKEYFREPYPVTTTVQVARLYDVEWLVEISAIAEIPRDRLKRPGE